AGEPGRAIDYLLKAADQALNSWALAEAVALFDAALELTSDITQRRQIQLERGIGRSKLGDYQAAIEDLSALLPELQGRERVEALLFYTLATEWTEQAAETLAGAEEALDLAERLGE